MAGYRAVKGKRRIGGVAAVLVLVGVIVIAIAAYFMLGNDRRETDAISGAAKEVGQAAERVVDGQKDK